MRNIKDQYTIIPTKHNYVIDTQDVNDPKLDIILKILEKNLDNFKVYYGEGDVITLTWN